MVMISVNGYSGSISAAAFFTAVAKPVPRFPKLEAAPDRESLR